MTVRLRGHHLLCVLGYSGRGYGARFVANLDRIAARLSKGEEVLVVSGPDDVCAPVADAAGSHCRNASISKRDARAARDVSSILGRPVAPGESLVLDADAVARLRAAFAAGAIRSACVACDWEATCSAIAAGGFGGARFRPRAAPLDVPCAPPLAPMGKDAEGEPGKRPAAGDDA